MPKFYNVVSRKAVPNHPADKTIFHKVGVIKVTGNGGWYLQLYQQPDTDFQIFPSQNDELPVIEFDSNETQ